MYRFFWGSVYIPHSSYFSLFFIRTYKWNVSIVSFLFSIYIFHELSKSCTELNASQTFIRVSEVQRFVFDSLMKHHLSRDNTFCLRRSIGKDVYKEETSIREINKRFITATSRWPQTNYNGPTVMRITIANGSFTVLFMRYLTALRGDAICLDRMLEEHWM